MSWAKGTFSTTTITLKKSNWIDGIRLQGDKNWLRACCLAEAHPHLTKRIRTIYSPHPNKSLTGPQTEVQPITLWTIARHKGTSIEPLDRLSAHPVGRKGWSSYSPGWALNGGLPSALRKTLTGATAVFSAFCLFGFCSEAEVDLAARFIGCLL